MKSRLIAICRNRTVWLGLACRLGPACRLGLACWLGLTCWLGLSFAAAQASGDGADAPACRAQGEDSAAIAAVTERFEIALDDGRLARPAGLAPAPPGFIATAESAALRRAAAARLVGTPVIVKPLAARDRWGRIVALLSPVDGGPEAGLTLLGLGAGRIADANEGAAGDPLCPQARRDAEASARKAGAGLWSDAYYAVSSADDRAGLLARAGQFALVEGTIRRVGAGRQRIFLDFANERDGFSVTATLRSVRAFEAAGIALRTLAGRRVRVRGVIEPFTARARADRPAATSPRMEIASPGALDLLDAAAPTDAQRSAAGERP